MFVMRKTVFKPLNLPEELIDELRVWKQAFSICYGQEVSYAAIIRALLDNIDTAEPDVAKEMDAILLRHPHLQQKVGKYKGIVGEDLLV